MPHDDIVTRLRVSHQPDCTCLGCEAADKIERLRKALAEIAENGNAEPFAADHARDALKANG